MLWLVPALMTASLVATPDDSRLLSSPLRRVRSTNSHILELLETGLRRSPTFAELVKAVNATDVIVYIEPVRELPTALAGRLLLLPISTKQRYLRIQVRRDLPPRDLIAL